MSVNLFTPDPLGLHVVPGVRLGIAEAGVKKLRKKDLLVIEIGSGSSVAGVFTQNRFCAAPVLVCKRHLSGAPTSIGAVVVNTGNANAGTGQDGLLNAERTCASLAALMGLAPTQVLPFSTGVIMEALPVERIEAALQFAIDDLDANHWLSAAQAIMTTDTVPKAASRQILLDGVTVTVTGISKGAGMIRPNMATMLGFIATDANIDAASLQQLARHAADVSFNCITIDGDTSTNDSLLLVATRRAGHDPITSMNSAHGQVLQAAMVEVATELAQAIVRDGEGATKFITVLVEGGTSEAECKRVAYAIAHSPLVKTAFFASDPNLGRILAAVGYAGIDDLDSSLIDLYLDDVLVAQQGGRYPGYLEADGQRVMKQAEITVRVVLNRGPAHAVVWTCDLSYDYVRINADYRS